MDDAWTFLEPAGPAGSDTYRLPSAPAERRKQGRVKLVVEISPDLHRRIIAICRTRRVPVNQAVRQTLESAFPR